MRVRSIAPMVAASAAALALLGGPADAAPQLFQSILSPMNGSGVSGVADLSLDGSLLTVDVRASGLEAGQVHPQHIHGFNAGGMPVPSMLPMPPWAWDGDGDGFVETPEGEEAIGPIILPLTSPPGAAEAFPTAGPDGSLTFTETYDLAALGIGDLLPLEGRVVELHGMTVPEGAGAGTSYEVNGSGGYLPMLPVAGGLIQPAGGGQPVPEPGTLALLSAGVIGLFGRAFARRHAS